MGELGDADEFFKVLGNELWAAVDDAAGLVAGELFEGALEDVFQIGFGHGLAQFKVDKEREYPSRVGQR